MQTLRIGVVALALFAASSVNADVVIDWNAQAGQIVMDAKLPAPFANRILAIVQTSVYESVNAITGRYPAGTLRLQAAPGASIDAAVAAANHTVLARLLPEQKAAVDAAYQAALAKIDDGPARAAGIALGEQAAAAIVAQRADDGAAAVETYRPRTEPGVYLPTTIPAVVQWAQR